MNRDYWNSFYTGIVPPRGTGAWGTNTPTWAQPSPVGSPYLSASERARLEQQLAQSKALQANMLPTPATASGPAWNQPTELDLAAIDKWNAGMSGDTGSMLSMFPETAVNPAVAAATGAGNPVTNVTGKMQPANRNGGLLDLIFGPSKNGMSGLAGLLGGPDAGGLLGMLGQRSTSPASSTAPTHKQARDAAERSGQTVSGTPSKHGRYFNFDTNSWM